MSITAIGAGITRKVIAHAPEICVIGGTVGMVVGGVMGVVFLRGTEMNRQMYEAMVCRGFTDDYEGL